MFKIGDFWYLWKLKNCNATFQILHRIHFKNRCTYCIIYFVYFCINSAVFIIVNSSLMYIKNKSYQYSPCLVMVARFLLVWLKSGEWYVVFNGLNTIMRMVRFQTGYSARGKASIHCWQDHFWKLIKRSLLFNSC